MSIIYGFDISCSGLSKEEAEKFQTVVQDHPIGWVSGDEGAHEDAEVLHPGITVRGDYICAYVESKCPGQFDDAVAALEDAVHRIWRALGRYVDIDANVLYIEDTPSESVATDEDAYDEWKAGASA